MDDLFSRSICSRTSSRHLPTADILNDRELKSIHGDLAAVPGLEPNLRKPSLEGLRTVSIGTGSPPGEQLGSVSDHCETARSPTLNPGLPVAPRLLAPRSRPPNRGLLFVAPVFRGNHGSPPSERRLAHQSDRGDLEGRPGLGTPGPTATAKGNVNASALPAAAPGRCRRHPLLSHLKRWHPRALDPSVPSGSAVQRRPIRHAATWLSWAIGPPRGGDA